MRELLRKCIENLIKAFTKKNTEVNPFPPPYMLKRKYHIESIGPFSKFQEAREYIIKLKRTKPNWDQEGVDLYMWDTYPNQPNLNKNIIPQSIWDVEEEDISK